MRRLAVLVVALASEAASIPAAAAEFRSVAAAAVLYDGPSKQARRLYVAPRGMPVEIVSTVGPWIKVRDMDGDVVWIERADLAERRNVVSSALLVVRQQPQDGAPAVIQVDRGVLLDLVDGAAPSSGWVRVRHRDGAAGWVRTTEVWGL